MQYKDVPISDSVSVAVPMGLTPDEVAKYIASRIAYVNFGEVEAECQQMLDLCHRGNLIPFEKVLEEIS